MAQRQLSQQLLKELFDYDPQGFLVNKVTRGRSAKAGKRTCKELVKSYRQVSLFGKMYREHQLIWCLLKGDWPTLIDHIDGTRQNNKIENLQVLSHRDNIRKVFIGKNIWLNPKSKRYIVAIYVNNKKIHVGCYNTLEEAIVARALAESTHWGLHGNTN